MTTTSNDASVLVGLDEPDDAAVYRVAPDTAIVQTVDFFTPIVDDPYDWGRIAAANALSDVYAMGGRPVTALSLIGWPRSLGFDLLGRVVDGAVAVCTEAGVAIVGGHSVDDPEPKFGLAVTGTVHPNEIVRKTGAYVGCVFVLTKPLGMGVISTGIKQGVTTPETTRRAIEVMSALNRDASEAMLAIEVAAATDVTGFGLVGHLSQMLTGEIGAQLSFGDIPIIPEALELARQGIVPAGSKRNDAATKGKVRYEGLDEAQRTVLFDAQTSGGLLIAVDARRSPHLLDMLAERGVTEAAVIGHVVPGEGGIDVGP